MPTYDYECSKCGHRFEEFQSITAKSLKKCPSCKTSSLKRLIGTGAGLIFRGSGFYCTDYKKGSAPAPSSASPAKDAPPSCANCPKANGNAKTQD